MDNKICTDCGNEFPATEQYFHKETKGKYGVRSKCKTCRHIERVAYYENNKEVAIEYSKNYRANKLK